MKKLILLSFLFISIPCVARAQTTATPANQFGWLQTAPDLATANSYTYKYYLDSATTGIAFTAVTCVASTAGAFDCSVNIPAITPGTHTISLTASNAAGESAKNTPFTFTMIIVPGVPGNIRIK